MAVLPKSIEVVTGGVTFHESALQSVRDLASFVVHVHGRDASGKPNGPVLAATAASPATRIECVIQPDDMPKLGDLPVAIERLKGYHMDTGLVLLETTVAHAPNRPSAPLERVYGFVVDPNVAEEQSTVFFHGDEASLKFSEVRKNFDGVLLEHLAKMPPTS